MDLAIARRRLMKDFKSLEENPPPGISAAPSENNIMFWEAIIAGPHGSPWEGGAFQLTIEFPNDYPLKPPKVQFVSLMFHPNIDDDGTICLNILKHEWTPVLDVASILVSIQSLLFDEPNMDCPVDLIAAGIYVLNRNEYKRIVRDVAERSWRA